MNYFELYDIPVSLNPDQDHIKQKFFDLSKKFHPDFHANSTPEEQQHVLEMSTMNTNAFNTLKDKWKTIEYVLAQENYLEDVEKEKLPADFLMEMMEINEKLMELEMDFDREEFGQVTKAWEAASGDLHNRLQTLEEDFEKENVGDETYQKLKDIYLKNKYLLRIKETLDKFAARS